MPGSHMIQGCWPRRTPTAPHTQWCCPPPPRPPASRQIVPVLPRAALDLLGLRYETCAQQGGMCRNAVAVLVRLDTEAGADWKGPQVGFGGSSAAHAGAGRRRCRGKAFAPHKTHPNAGHTAVAAHARTVCLACCRTSWATPT